MSDAAPDGRTKPERDDDRPQTQDDENGRAESWQAGPSKRNVSNATYTTQSFKLTDGRRRTGLRTIDNHASWREVYRACHVGVGVDE